MPLEPHRGKGFILFVHQNGEKGAHLRRESSHPDPLKYALWNPAGRPLQSVGTLGIPEEDRVNTRRNGDTKSTGPWGGGLLSIPTPVQLQIPLGQVEDVSRKDTPQQGVKGD